MRRLFVIAVAVLASPAAAQARSGPYYVTDWSQPDRPDYELTFRKPLRPGSVFNGIAHDDISGADVRVRFTVTKARKITRFRGPAADTSQPQFPIRATFYYAWYPEAWSRATVFPYSRFVPSLDYYSADDAQIVQEHLAALRYAHLNAGIYSWWGPLGYPLTDTRFWRYLAAARTTPFRWALYYEREGYEDPSVDKIRSDLEYIRDLYASKPGYLRIDGRFVVFVYGGPGDTCETVTRRWGEANTVGAYIVLKAFAGYQSCAAQPQAWHEYSAALPAYSLPPSAFMISPGFDEASATQPRLARDLARWREDVGAMVASGAAWQLILSFNEWPEGSSIESARQWETPSGYGAYVDVLHDVLP